MTRVLLIGSGAREHAIARAVHRSKGELWSVIDKVNPGITSLSTKIFNGETTPEKWLDEIEGKIDVAIIGPEAPLAQGVTNTLLKHNIPTVAPTKQSAQIETSKQFAREIMKDYDIPGKPNFQVCTNLKQAEQALEYFHGKVAIKPDGLTGGKGVWVYGDHFSDIDQGLNYIHKLLQKHKSVIIEEKLEGQEFTAQFLSNGKTVFPFPLVKDYKRAYNGNKGPNTGSMGSISYPDHSLPYVTEIDYSITKQISQQILTAIEERTHEPYIGILYLQAMKTKKDVKIIEFNARFGDPEGINVLALLNSSFTDILVKIANHESVSMNFQKLATTCVYLTPKGYPLQPKPNTPIQLTNPDDESIYYGSVNKTNGVIHTTTSRSIAVLGKGPNLDKARKEAYDKISTINGELHYRTDIGLI